MKTVHVISVSGGKDSTATLLIALERCPADPVMPIFCDTGNEHQDTYDYLVYLERALGVTITRLKADFNPAACREAPVHRQGRAQRARQIRPPYPLEQQGEAPCPCRDVSERETDEHNLHRPFDSVSQIRPGRHEQRAQGNQSCNEGRPRREGRRPGRLGCRAQYRCLVPGAIQPVAVLKKSEGLAGIGGRKSHAAGYSSSQDLDAVVLCVRRPFLELRWHGHFGFLSCGVVMKERPILFSSAMVRALMAGTKTQTRRVVKLANGQYIPPSKRADVNGWNQLLRNCPHGQPGDRLWVRENGWECAQPTPRMMREGADTWAPYYFDADGYDDPADAAELKGWGFRRRPSIHMPRWASRILLEITNVRVERLQDISRADAQAEGITFTDYGRKCGHTGKGWTEVGDCPAPPEHHPQRPGWSWRPTTSHQQCMDTPQGAFWNLWSEINGDESFSANPWVWAVSFRIASPVTTPSAKEAS